MLLVMIGLVCATTFALPDESTTKIILPSECETHVARTNHDLRANTARRAQVLRMSPQRWLLWERRTWDVWNNFLRPNLPPLQGQPEIRLVDIGAGFGCYNIHVARYYNMTAHITYFDGEGAKCYSGHACERAMPLDGWHPKVEEMPFYHNNLACARRIAVANGVPSTHVHIVQASKANLKSMAGQIDVIYSHTSYGFHYPVTQYHTEAYEALKPGGLLLLTLRNSERVKLPPSAKDQKHRPLGSVDVVAAIRQLEEAGFKCHIRQHETYTCNNKCHTYRCFK